MGLSVLLHGILVAVLVYGWVQFRHPPPPVSALAIDATVVSQATLDAARRPAAQLPPAPTPPPPASSPAPAVEQPVPVPVPPPPPDAAAQQAEAQAEAARKAAAEQAEAAHAAAQQQAADREAAREQAEREAQAKVKAAQELAARKAAAQAEAEAKAAAVAKAQAQASQAELQRSLEAEERVDAARASGVMSNWVSQITARIQGAWNRPPSARAGIECTLYVTQVPGGVVTDAKLGTCNGDDAVKQSILDAAYRASPLPPPPDPALFERNLEVTFRPTD
jgi:colicin import membrane protein